MSLTPEQIDQNWKQYVQLVKSMVDDPRKHNVLVMIGDIEERLALAPASTRTSLHCAYPGGLVEHSLRVLSVALKAVKAYGWEDVSKPSLVLVCLMHDLGKCCHVSSTGEQVDVYLPQDSDWHREKLGETYKWNQDVFNMTVPHRGLWLLQKYGVALSDEEWMAIMLHDGWSLEENRRYCMSHKSKLITVLQHADYVATIEEKLR